MATEMVEPVELVRLVHASPTRVCAVVTGGGVLALAWLFGEPGASRTFLDAQIPYSMRALDEYVGVDAEQHVSPTEADRMAATALMRGHRLAESMEGIAGVSCTATIATDRPKKGEHRCAAAWAREDEQSRVLPDAKKGSARPRRRRRGGQPAICSIRWRRLAASTNGWTCSSSKAKPSLSIG